MPSPEPAPLTSFLKVGLRMLNASDSRANPSLSARVVVMAPGCDRVQDVGVNR